MSISLSEIFLFLAAAQGFFLTLFIFQKYSKIYAARFVGVLIFLYSITVTGMLVNDLNYAVQIQELYAGFLALPFVIGPLQYFFALTLSNPDRRFRKKDILHFAPAILLFAFLPTYVFFSGITFVESKETLQGVIPAHFIILNWIILVHATTYSLLTLAKLRFHARRIKNLFSSVEKVQLRWLLDISYFALVVVGVFCIENILMSFSINLTNYYTASSIMVAIYVYTLGYLGLLKMDVFLDPNINQSITQLPANEDIIDGQTKYQKSGLSEKKANEYLDQLLELMQERKPYHDNSLTLNQLAKSLNMTPHNLSEVLNAKVGQNFFDFINSYRVEEVKKALADKNKRNLTLLAIAFDAGFNSKTAFNTIFKKLTGATPSEFRQSAVNNL